MRDRLCKGCAGLFIRDDMGLCKWCGHDTTSGSYVICRACADKSNVCQLCLKPLGKEVKIRQAGGEYP